MITLEQITKVYKLGKIKVHALRGVSFRVNKGDFVVIQGPSGSGKSTMLNIIGTIDQPTSGTLLINDLNPGTLRPKQLAQFRGRTMGFIFQNFNLIEVLNVLENVEYPLVLNKLSMNRQHIYNIIEAVGLTDVMKHRPNELSGGQQQRVAIARALVVNPEIVLADEPTANLDSETSQTIIALMKQLNRTYKTTFIISTHDPLVAEHANTKITLRNGQIHG